MNIHDVYASQPATGARDYVTRRANNSVQSEFGTQKVSKIKQSTLAYESAWCISVCIRINVCCAHAQNPQLVYIQTDRHVHRNCQYLSVSRDD